jgi:hypothetical protein
VPTYGIKQTFTAVMWEAINKDDGITRYSKEIITLGIFVEPVNDAPLAAGKTHSFTEDTTWTGTVQSLFGDTFDDSKDNKQAVGGPRASTADEFAGIFITGNAALTEQGVWQYFDGSVWQDIPTSGLSDTNAFYLNKDTQIRFVPVPDYNGAVGSLDFRVMEDHDDSAKGDSKAGDYLSGSSYDLTGKTGGEQRISGGPAAVLTLGVTAVNDAPIALRPGEPIEITINEDFDQGLGAGGDTVANLFGGRFDDSKDAQRTGSNPAGSEANTLAGVLIRTLPTGAEAAKGVWQYFDSTANAWKALEVGMFVKNTDLIRFEPSLDYNGTATGLSVCLVENSGAFANAAAHQQYVLGCFVNDEFDAHGAFEYHPVAFFERAEHNLGAIAVGLFFNSNPQGVVLVVEA